MNLDNLNSQSFLGRAKIIKDADKICRDINLAFPHFSPSYSWVNSGKPQNFVDLFCRYDRKLELIRISQYKTDYAYDYYNNLLSLVQKYKCANCGELSEIVYLACKKKNLKNVNLIGIYGFNPMNNKLVDYDHMAVSFTDGKNTVIIDPWLGFADFAQNCLVKYKQNYHKFLARFNPNLKLTFKTEPSVKICKSDFQDLMKKYAEV